MTLRWLAILLALAVALYLLGLWLMWAPGIDPELWNQYAMTRITTH